MIYTYTCIDCGKSFDDRSTIANKDELRECPECGEPAEYNFGATQRGSNVATHEDITSYMYRKFGGNPNWKPPQSRGVPVGNSRGKCIEGGSTHFPGDPRHRRRET